MSYLLHHLLISSAQTHSDRVAVQQQEHTITYRQLDEKSNQLANTLSYIGIERGDRVGIYLDKSIEAVIAIFGILKAGATYVPLDSYAPIKRIAFIIKNCQIKTLISTKQRIDVLGTNSLEELESFNSAILVDQDAQATQWLGKIVRWSEVLQAPCSPPADPNLIEKDLAYILYTSGSTGTPKGVMISHRASLTFVNWADETFEVTAEDRVSSHAPFHFDLSIFDIFTTIKAGGTIILLSAALSVFPINLAKFIAEEKISIWYSVPSILTSLVLYGRLEKHTFPTLRTILFAGEVFPIKYLRQLMGCIPHACYYNLYGPTETNVCTYYQVPPLEIELKESIPIGKACANTEVFVLGESNEDEGVNEKKSGGANKEKGRRGDGETGRIEIPTKMELTSPKPAQVELSPGEIEPLYHLLTLSAKSEKALNALTQNYLTFLDKTEDSLANICSLPRDFSETYLPVAYPHFTFWQYPTREVFSYVKLHAQPGQETLKADLQLFGKEGQVYAELIGLQLKKARSQSLQQKELWKDWLCQVVWKEVEKTVETVDLTDKGDWLILAESTGLGETLADLLNAHQMRSHLVYADKTARKFKSEQDYINWKNPADWQQLLADRSYRGVVYLWSLDQNNSCDSSCEQVLHLVQALTSANISPRLWLVTKGAQSILKDDIVSVWQTPIWGLGKTLSLEHQEFSTTCLDLPSDYSCKETAKSLLQELLTPDLENQISYRNGVRYGARLEPCQPIQTPSIAPVALKLSSYGTLDNLTLVPLASSSLAPDEVEIKVRASGLNFRDVLRALGMMREIEESLGIVGSASDILFGFECAGTIERVGEQVSEFKVGDAVIAYASGSLASVVKAKATLVVSKPPELSFEEAATIPVTFLTAYYGLVKCAQIGSGDRVLIHNGAGGVGQAAVQLAQLKGAEVFATASPPKWDFLESLGIKHIYNSRTLEFAEQVMTATNGKGVNVILNSLTGKFIDQSFEVLAQGGRFVEIGKFGIWDEQKLQALRPDVTYFPFDLGEMDGDKISALLLEVMTIFKEGKLKPLPLKVFPITEFVNAFRYMQQAKHIGKVVLNFQNRENCLVHQNSSYLIAGGLGALGLQVAQWLVEQGAKHLVLTGRSSVKPAANQVIKKLELSGTKVSVVEADISNQEDVKKILLQCPNLAGIVHTAGVLADGLLREQTPMRFKTVMASKVQGAWNLHVLTQGLPLDFFVCFSSAASLLGNAGQSNYAAANAFLDALAHYRRSQSLPSLSINWGPWGEVGMAATLTSRLQAQGWGIISPEQGLQALDHLVKSGDSSQVGVLPMNWSKFLERLPEKIPFLENFQTTMVAPSQEQPALLSQLKATLVHERRTTLMEHVRSAIRKIIGLNASTRIEPRQSLFDLGLDSLMAVELRNYLEKSIEHSLRSTLLFDYPTLEALVNYLLQEVLVLEDMSAQQTEEEITTSSQVLEELPEEELDTLLASQYEKLNKLLGNI
ncbi:MAG: SDR family NAD(P)-dependent oxidoreductase [Symploca sp. SIO2E9]|nr:SDR family NAD(P)-dependent oxidoreductase [Symploca sp. SIO2E9]